MSENGARQSPIDRFEIARDQIDLHLCYSSHLERTNRNHFGKMANSMHNIVVHPVRIIFDFLFNSILVDIIFVLVVCRIFFGRMSTILTTFDSSFPCSVASRCPSCQQPISKDRLVNDKELQKEIQSLEVFCTNKSKGCEWSGALRELSTHLETCGFVTIDCPNECGVKFERRFMDKHKKDDCAKRTTICEFCKKIFSILINREFLLSIQVKLLSYSKKKFLI